jgi:hypothetical protein
MLPDKSPAIGAACKQRTMPSLVWQHFHAGATLGPYLRSVVLAPLTSNRWSLVTDPSSGWSVAQGAIRARANQAKPQ